MTGREQRSLERPQAVAERGRTLEVTDALQATRLTAGGLLALAGVVHLGYADSHFTDRHDAGLFFVVAGVNLLIAAWLLIYARPSRAVAAVAALGTLGIVATYAVSRTVGMPIGPHSEPEAAGLLDLVTTLGEVVVITLLGVVVLGEKLFGHEEPARGRNALLLLLAGAGIQSLALLIDTLLVDAAAAPEHSPGHPVHIVLAAGFLLSLTGLLWQLLGADNSSAASTRFFARPVLANLALVLVLGFTGALSVTAAGNGGHSHPGLAHRESEEQIESHPTFQSLKETLRVDGTRAAFKRLDELTKSDEDILRLAHSYAHLLGRYSFTRYGDAAVALRECTAGYAYGCYHGVLEEYLGNKSRLQTKDVTSLCTSDLGDFIRFQCLHGLGHGLTIFLEHDIYKALDFCDALDGSWEQSSCYGGVFMENIVAFNQEHEHAGERKKFLKPDEPLYPCNVIAEKYRFQCFNLQTSALLMFNGYDFADAARKCDQAPGNYATVCYYSLGRDISGWTLRNPRESADLCMRGSETHWNDCFIGAVKDFINTDSNVEGALKLCVSVPDSGKSACYGGMGEMIFSLYATDPARRMSECGRAEEAYVGTCREAARF